jgi:ribonuclease D
MPDAIDLQPVAPCSARLITNLADLDDLARRLMDSPVVAVDTESDSLYSYTEKVCLVQFSLPGVDYIVDPLSTYTLEPLAPVFANPAIEKVFHGADYDVVSLKRGYAFHLANIFDTAVAARILGRKNCGLAALLAEHLGVQMDKTMQRSDWGRRPLTAEQLTYACGDTRYLLDLHRLLLAELRRLDREQEARESFAELANLEPRSRFFDPDGFWSIKGLRDLDEAGKRIVRAIYRWREDQARWEDRPAFKVLGDRTLVAIAQHKPLTFDALRRTHALSEYQLTRYGHQLADIVGKAVRTNDRIQPPHHHRDGNRPSRTTLLVYDRLRSWRKERAAQRGVEPDVIVSNDALMSLSTQRPRTASALEAIAGLGAWRRREYGQEIMAAIAEVVDGDRQGS